jgi:hypothetical protein
MGWDEAGHLVLDVEERVLNTSHNHHLTLLARPHLYKGSRDEE